MTRTTTVELVAVGIDAELERVAGRGEDVAHRVAVLAVGIVKQLVRCQVQASVGGDHQRNGCGRGVVEEGLKKRFQCFARQNMQRNLS